MRTNWTHEYERGFGDGVRMEKDHPTYTHRNGETEPPTEIGHYWIKDVERGETEKIIYVDCLEHHWREHTKLEWVLHDENPSENARYFGPIPVPTWP